MWLCTGKRNLLAVDFVLVNVMGDDACGRRKEAAANTGG